LDPHSDLKELGIRRTGGLQCPAVAEVQQPPARGTPAHRDLDLRRVNSRGQERTQLCLQRIDRYF
jgi:hypothetical protein